MSTERTVAIAEWTKLLNDATALLESPGTHHKQLLNAANSLFLSKTITCDDLSDMLELADGALAYAIEVQVGTEP